MKQLYCKNCGAPIEHRYTHRCRYCDTVIFGDDIEDEQEEDKEIDIDLELYNCDKFNKVSKKFYDAIKDSLDKPEEKKEIMISSSMVIRNVLKTILPTIVIFSIMSIINMIINMLNK